MSSSPNGNESNHYLAKPTFESVSHDLNTREWDDLIEKSDISSQSLPTEDVEPIQPLPPIQFMTHTSKTKRSVTENFMVQCADCKKWRLIPSMQYCKIKETQLQVPFVCERASAWTPNMSCNIPQDGTTWSSIPPIPTGWSRSVHIRRDSTKFADVYYFPPSGKRLRSSAEVQSFLDNHPEYVREGVNPSQFSFQLPKPLDDNYVKKRARPVKPTKLSEDNNCKKDKK
ncbi:unnamed protein product [Arabidopsis halleri]